MPRRYIKHCDCRDVEIYVKDILRKNIRSSKEIYQLCEKVKKEFETGNIYVDTELYEKYIKIGYLFFPEIFPFQKFLTAVCLCTFYKGTLKARWRKNLIVMGRGNGKDGMIAWWACCLTSVYHGVKRYDVDIIANNMTQSLRPIGDIEYMCKDQGDRMKKFYMKLGDSIVSLKTDSSITARSSDAKQQDGLRSGAVIFNEIHLYENYKKLNVMITGLGKKEDPRTMYFTTNGEIRGGVLDDLLDTSKDILRGTVDDKGLLPIIYKLDDKNQVNDSRNWVMANPAMPYRETLRDEIEDEYDSWKRNPDGLPAFMQKRMNLPESVSNKEVASWETICLTEQKYDYSRLQGKSCVVGIDLSRTTDWTAFNMLFYDEEIEKFVCINHAFICANNRDLKGIKAPWQDWCDKGLATLVEEKEVNPDKVVDYIEELAQENGYIIEFVVFDEYKKGVMLDTMEKHNYSLEMDNLKIIRLRDIAQTIPVIERGFLNEKFIWNNRMLMWACNNTCVVPWRPKTTGGQDIGNQMYAKINERFRKTDPYMAFVHSMCMSSMLVNISTIDYTQLSRVY